MKFPIVFLLSLFLFTDSIFSKTFLLTDESIVTGVELSDKRILVKQVFIAIPEISSRIEIKGSEEIWRIKLFDGATLTGSVERFSNYIVIGSNPVFKDQKKVMKSDIVGMKEVRRIQVQTYLGYTFTGVIEKESDEAVHLTNIYNPEGYVFTQGVRKQYDADLKTEFKDYAHSVKDQAYIRPANNWAAFLFASYTYTQDVILRDYVPYLLGLSFGTIKGVDRFIGNNKRRLWIPLVGVFYTGQFLGTSTAILLNMNLAGGLYWKYKVSRFDFYLGALSGVSYFHVKDQASFYQLGSFIRFSFLMTMKIRNRWSVALNINEDLHFEEKRLIPFPYFNLGVQYDF